MIRVNVITKGQIIKNLMILTIFFSGIIATFKFGDIMIKEKKFDKINMNSKGFLENIPNNTLYSYLNSSVPIIAYIKSERDEKIYDRRETKSTNRNGLKNMLNIDLGIIRNVGYNDNINGMERMPEDEYVSNNEEISSGVSTTEGNTIISKNFMGVEIKNETKFILNEDILSSDLKIKTDTGILIFHTHTCESYTPTEKYNYEMEGGSYRTTNTNLNVARIGEELEELLKKSNYKVIHDKTLHDYPAYSGSYGRSLKTVQNILSNNEGYDVVLDIHRDAIGDSSFRPVTTIENKQVAQLMIVVGTDGGGLTHKDWQENLKFAIRLVQEGNRLYPGIFRPIIVRNSRYNQQVANGALIIEVGATGNTLEECLTSIEYFDKILNEVLK